MSSIGLSKGSWDYDPGIVNQDIQPSEGFHRLSYRGFHSVDVGIVGLDCERPGTVRLMASATASALSLGTE
jgi:hypothetical protein